MTTTHRITTCVAVILSLAGAAAPGAFAGSRNAQAASAAGPAAAAYYSPQDKQMVRPATDPTQPTGAYYSLQDKTMIAPAKPASAAGRTANVTSAQPVVRIETPNSGFDWGDAGIGAVGGIALCMIGVGGALAVSQRRERRTATPQA